MKENEQEKQEREHGQGRVMQMAVEIGGQGKAKMAFPMLGAAANTYSSPTSPGSAPGDTASTLLYQHSDHLTTRVTTDNAGTLSNQQAHYPYGENWYASGAADGSVQRKFTSYRKEGGSLASGQINYAVARYHGARIGRFHRPDPVRGNFRNPQRLNRYAYVTNNPVRYVDPRGLDMVDPANAEGFWGGGAGDRNPDPVVNYAQGETFSLGGLHYRTGDGDGGGTGYWYNDLQNSYMDWLNASPVGCWDGSGFRDPTCVANGGDSSSGSGSGLLPFAQELPPAPPPCLNVALDEFKKCAWKMGIGCAIGAALVVAGCGTAAGLSTAAGPAVFMACITTLAPKIGQGCFAAMVACGGLGVKAYYGCEIMRNQDRR